MSLIEDIRTKILNHDYPLTSILRQAMVLRGNSGATICWIGFDQN